MGLVDDEQTEGSEEWVEDFFDEAGAREPFGADEHDIDSACSELTLERRPVIDVGGVEGDGPQPRARGSGNLIAHERKKGRDDKDRTGAGIADSPRRDPVDSRLAPAGRLDDEGATPLAHEHAYRVKLIRANHRARASKGCDDLLGGPLETGLVDGRDPTPREGGRAGRASRQV